MIDVHTTSIATGLLILVGFASGQDGKPAPGKPQPKHLLRYSFRKGSTGKVQMRHDLEQSVSEALDPDEMTMIRDFTWKVIDTDARWATMEMTLNRVRVQAEGMFGDSNFDSKEDDAENAPANIGGQRLGQAVRFRVDTRGRLEVIDTLGDKSKPETLSQMRIMIRELPELPVSVGDKWTTETKQPMWGDQNGSVKVENTLLSVARGKVRLAYVMMLEMDKQDITVETKDSDGTVTFDLGRFVPDAIDQQFQMKVSGQGVPILELSQRYRVGPPGSLEDKGADETGGLKPKNAARSGERKSSSR